MQAPCRPPNPAPPRPAIGNAASTPWASLSHPWWGVLCHPWWGVLWTTLQPLAQFLAGIKNLSNLYLGTSSVGDESHKKTLNSVRVSTSPTPSEDMWGVMSSSINRTLLCKQSNAQKCLWIVKPTGWSIIYINGAIKHNPIHLQQISSITSYINLSLRAFSMSQLLLMFLEIRNSGATTSCQSWTAKMQRLMPTTRASSRGAKKETWPVGLSRTWSTNLNWNDHGPPKDPPKYSQGSKHVERWNLPVSELLSIAPRFSQP